MQDTPHPPGPLIETPGPRILAQLGHIHHLLSAQLPTGLSSSAPKPHSRPRWPRSQREEGGRSRLFEAGQQRPAYAHWRRGGILEGEGQGRQLQWLRWRKVRALCSLHPKETMHVPPSLLPFSSVPGAGKGGLVLGFCTLRRKRRP